MTRIEMSDHVKEMMHFNPDFFRYEFHNNGEVVAWISADVPEPCYLEFYWRLKNDPLWVGI